MVPATADPVPLAQHRGFLDHLAAVHATFWGFRGHVRTDPRPCNATASPTRRQPRGRPPRATRTIPGLFPRGWQRVGRAAPEAAAVGLGLARDPAPLAAAMADGPRTLVHGDWKFGNLGTWPDGRTVLLDWAWPGEAGPAVDLAWYLAVNCDRLPESKEDIIDAYRARADRRESRPPGGGTSSSNSPWSAASCSWAGPSPATRPSWVGRTERTAPTLETFHKSLTCAELASDAKGGSQASTGKTFGSAQSA